MEWPEAGNTMQVFTNRPYLSRQWCANISLVDLNQFHDTNEHFIFPRP